jgi:hypothetical protein
VRDRGPGDGPGREGGSACRGEKPPAGVESDEGPQGFVDAQPLARPPGRGGENGEGVAQQVAGAGQLVERVGVEPDEFLRAALPEPGEMTSAAGAAQPTADGGRRAAQRGGDPPISHACGLASQCGADHVGGVRPAWLQRGGQQDLSGSAPAAAHPPGPHVDRVRPKATNASAAAVPPPRERATASVAGAAHPSVGQGLLGRLGGADDDHRALQRA